MKLLNSDSRSSLACPSEQVNAEPTIGIPKLQRFLTWRYALSSVSRRRRKHDQRQILCPTLRFLNAPVPAVRPGVNLDHLF